jgi:hypothetical protein
MRGMKSVKIVQPQILKLWHMLPTNVEAEGAKRGV